ncbi:MAG: hypothetical protein H6Q73_2269 [Firmicutes bacterium]|nr:hypothetical protein [Bacillota bacterium]
MLRISKYQLFCLMVLFQFGTTALFVLGAKANQDAWFVIILAMAAGLVLNVIYTELYKQYPNDTLVEIIIKVLGKGLGTPLAFLVIFYFIHIAAHNIAEFSYIIQSTFLPRTPFIVVAGIFVLAAGYILFLGVEVFGRTSEVMLPIVVVFVLSVYVLVYISGAADLGELQPVLASDWRTLLKALPQVENAPFGETVVFLMYFCYADDKQAVQKVALGAVFMTGVLLVIGTITIIATLGIAYATIAAVPFLSVLQAINISDILTNLDSLGVSIISIGGLYKMATVYFAGISGMATLLNFKQKKWLLIPVGLFILWLAVSMPSFTFQRFLGQEVSTPYIHIMFQSMPVLLLCICILKKLVTPV